MVGAPCVQQPVAGRWSLKLPAPLALGTLGISGTLHPVPVYPEYLQYPAPVPVSDLTGSEAGAGATAVSFIHTESKPGEVKDRLGGSATE